MPVQHPKARTAVVMILPSFLTALAPRRLAAIITRASPIATQRAVLAPSVQQQQQTRLEHADSRGSEVPDCLLSRQEIKWARRGPGWKATLTRWQVRDVEYREKCRLSWMEKMRTKYGPNPDWEELVRIEPSRRPRSPPTKPQSQTTH